MGELAYTSILFIFFCGEIIQNSQQLSRRPEVGRKNMSWEKGTENAG